MLPSTPSRLNAYSSRRALLKVLPAALLLTRVPYAKAEEPVASISSYAQAEASEKPYSLQEVSALIDGHLIRWTRVPDGPCLGGGWMPVGAVTAQHFDMSQGAALALRKAMLLAAQIGAKLSILPGNYLIDRSISAELPSSLTIEFMPGACLVAAPGLSETVLHPRGSATNRVSCTTVDLTIINPRIDCSAGASPLGQGGAYCTALSFNYLRKVRIMGGELRGGNSPLNHNADSGISWVTCCDVTVENVRIEGFNDCAIYPGGNNMPGPEGDGGTGRITRCQIRKCRNAVAAKREMTLLIFEGNTVEDCLSGVSSQDVRSAGGVAGARRIEVSDNIFRRCLANIIRLRGMTQGFARNNWIYDFGYHPVTMKSAGANAVAIRLDGTKGFSLIDNNLALESWPRSNQLAIMFGRHIFKNNVYDHGNCFGSGNSYHNIPRIISFSSPGGPHIFVNEYFFGADPNPIGRDNANPATIVTYFDNKSIDLHVWSGRDLEITNSP